MTPPDHAGRGAPSRRAFLASLGAAGLSVLPGRRLLAESRDDRVRPLDFVHTHTGEELSLGFLAGGPYEPESLERVNRFLRDFRNGEVHPIDPTLLDLLAAVRGRLGSGAPFHVISGYRSPATNEMLRRTRGGQARNSLHLQGKAVDVRLPGVPLVRLRDAGLAVGRGGVGYYPASDFVHLDTGRVRRW
jgi:uncharacterized protein YcbK (DUF882 family)